ncbi:hypothetical protein JG559_03050 [Enterococcus faecalis]|uniref:Uncharacterized protein n=1 Tax=Enterococcus faecalis TaxID=1351 RepID=A0A974S696_ENTFL|nr:hypothetical protein JG559_03050 [Enterococcus faecalis]
MNGQPLEQAKKLIACYKKRSFQKLTELAKLDTETLLEKKIPTFFANIRSYYSSTNFFRG